VKQFWASAGCALRDSTWIGAAWSWLLRFVGYAAGPLLFICLVYSSVLSMPGVSSPGPTWDLVVLIVSNTALELGAMSMPEIAAKSSDEEARAHADTLSVQLTRLFLAGVMWAGIEHMLVVANVPYLDAIKYIASFVFLVVRAVYTTKYMKCIYSLRKSPVQRQVQQAEMQGAMSPDEVQRLVQGAVQAMRAECSAQVQGATLEVQRLVQQVQGAMQSATLSEMQSAEVQAQVQWVQQALHLEVQGAMREMQDALLGQLREVQAQVQAHHEEAQRGVKRAPVRVQRAAQVQSAEVQSLGVQGAMQEEVAPEEVQGAIEPQTDVLGEVQGAMQEEVAPVGGFRSAIFAYVQLHLAQGYTPTVQECMDAVRCCKRSATTYRKDALVRLGAMEVS
jgi:hypothetical protein